MKTMMAIAILACLPQAAPRSNPLFDELKKLEGHWSSDQKDHGADVTYKLSSGGTVLVETMAMANHAEMITMYHPDGDGLALTHYCMLGNQPRMKAERGGTEDKLTFKFAGAGNLKSENDPHMHDMALEILGDDHVKATWTLYKDGKPAGTATLDMTRKKK